MADKEKRAAEDRVQEIAPVDAFFKKAKETNFSDQASSRKLGDLLKEILYEDPIHQLIVADKKSSAFWKEEGTKPQELLRWMLEKGAGWFTQESGAEFAYPGKKPLHLAIELKNTAFLECFLRFCGDKSRVDQSLQEVAIHALEQTNDRRDWNCLHAAIEAKLPCSVDMVRFCSDDALLKPDGWGETPFHTAIRYAGSDEGHRIFREILNVVKDRENKAKSAMHKSQLSCEPQDRLLSKLLKTTNKKGFSPYLESFYRAQRFRDKYDSAPSPKNHSEWRRETELLKDLRDLIFGTFEVSKLLELSRALYGTQGHEKDLCLDMSDFNQSSYSFRDFVKRLTGLDPSADLEVTAKPVDPNAAAKPAKGKERDLEQFERTLFFVTLPNLNNIRKPCPHDGVRTLFWWLHHKQNVQKIKTLTIPDSSTSPMSDELMAEAVIGKFEIEQLDWRRLDINLDPLTLSPHAGHFTKLTLYSSGNWSVLHHWVLSEDGLAKLPNVTHVKIGIVHLNPSEGVHDLRAHNHHKNLASEYKTRLLEGLETKKATQTAIPLNYRYTLAVDDGAKWEFPVLKYHQDNELHVPKLQFIDQLVDCHNYLDCLAMEKNTDPLIKRFLDVARAPRPGEKDKRIKIAVIDNGVDKLQDAIKDKIAKGISYVTADAGSSHRMLPWWMVAHPHGTQMASLIAQANPNCRLYVARVGRGPKDILTEHAVKAVKWAVEQEVDIISMSWTTKKEDDRLDAALKEAVMPTNGRRPTLVFCSVADEGNYSGKVYPVQSHPSHILSVAATDAYGHLTPASDRAGGEISIQVPGEAVAADGPSYRNTESSDLKVEEEKLVSGSSVATALAAGIASLALVMLQTYNKLSDEQWNHFHTKDYMKSVFDQMHGDKMGIDLSELFPSGALDDEKLGKLWDCSRFKPKRGDQRGSK